MMKVNRILTIGLLVFSACKPQELSLIGNLGRKVRVSTADGFIYAELANAEDKIFTASNKVYAWYGKGLIHSSQGDYSGKLLHGQYIAYYAVNKQLKEKGEYAYGLKNGKWLMWQPDGTLLETQHWYRGLKNGPTLRYDSLGKLKEKVRYNNGKLLEKKKGTSLLVRLKKMLKGKKK
ncbi:hypothetical protein HDC92_004649 [Pedobacter sp. AK017]|uniref:toxin-antitoxin system YwqK family antitoxin n=1 Tax=Pedobacter sp. AK017 TaxID=2723073 RepID=UPI00160DBAE9|nr:hypothetical protein [Pedobacter sp. AK017]MBB5440945.1 hypothetical protein [Pedobacter sp. AK017]